MGITAYEEVNVRNNEITGDVTVRSNTDDTQKSVKVLSNKIKEGIFTYSPNKNVVDEIKNNEVNNVNSSYAIKVDMSLAPSNALDSISNNTNVGSEIKTDIYLEKFSYNENTYNLPKMDILKVGHHGSNTSTSKEFVQSISPKISLISAGKNNIYGHPHQITLQNLKNSNVFITKKDGAIEINLKNLAIKTAR